MHSGDLPRRRRRHVRSVAKVGNHTERARLRVMGRSGVGGDESRCIFDDPSVVRSGECGKVGFATQQLEFPAFGVLWRGVWRDVPTRAGGRRHARFVCRTSQQAGHAGTLGREENATCGSKIKTRAIRDDAADALTADGQIDGPESLGG